MECGVKVAIFRILVLIFMLSCNMVGIGHAQAPEDTYHGSIQVSGTVRNVFTDDLVSFYLPYDPKPKVVIHAAAGGTFDVQASTIGIVPANDDRWRNESHAYKHDVVVPTGETEEVELIWGVNLRGWVDSLLPNPHTLPDLLWKVVLTKNEVEKDVAYVRHSVSGSVYAINHWALPIYELSATRNTPTVHLYENPQKLKVTFSVLDERMRPGAPIVVRVGKKRYPLGITTPRRPGIVKPYSLVLSSRMHGDLTNSLVEVLIENKVERRMMTPEEFESDYFEAKFGVIHVSDDCAACKGGFCSIGTVSTSLGGNPRE